MEKIAALFSKNLTTTHFFLPLNQIFTSALLPLLESNISKVSWLPLVSISFRLWLFVGMKACRLAALLLPRRWADRGNIICSFLMFPRMAAAARSLDESAMTKLETGEALTPGSSLSSEPFDWRGFGSSGARPPGSLINVLWSRCKVWGRGCRSWLCLCGAGQIRTLPAVWGWRFYPDDFFCGEITSKHTRLLYSFHPR